MTNEQESKERPSTAVASDSQSTVRATPRVLALAVAAFAMAALVRVDVSPAAPLGIVRAVLGLYLVLGGGVALGPLLRATPVIEPSRLKLGAFASLLGPPLVALVYVTLGALTPLGVTDRWSATFVALGLLSLLGAGRSIGVQRAGAAAGLSCLWALLIAAVGAALAWSDAGLLARVSSTGAVTHATLAEAWAELGRPGNPWFEGGVVGVRPAVGALVAAVTGPTGIDALFALPLLVGWSLGLSAVLAYLSAAALFRESSRPGAGLRDLAAALLAPIACVAVDRPSFWIEVDPTVMFGRAFALGALLAGLHAVRRGARPWPGLAATMVALAALVDPMLGAGLFGALLIAALVAGRSMLASLAVAALLPAFLQWRWTPGAAIDGSLVLGAIYGGGSWGTGILAVHVLAALGLVVAVRSSRAVPSEVDRRASLCGAVFAAACVGLLVGLAPMTSKVLDGAMAGASGESTLLLRVAASLAAVSAAGVLTVVPTRALRAAVAAAAIAACGVLAWNRALPPAPTASDGASAVLPFHEQVTGLEVSVKNPLIRGFDEALVWLRASEFAGRQDVVLLRGALPDPNATAASPPSTAPLLSGIGLWVDAQAPPGWGDVDEAGSGRAETPTELGDTWRDRVAALDALYHKRNRWRPEHKRLLESASARGTTFVFVVTELDRRRTTERGEGPRGVDVIVHLHLGAEVVFDAGVTSVYVLPGRLPEAAPE